MHPEWTKFRGSGHKYFARPDADTTADAAALTVTATATGEGLTPGTPAYMSPEQLRGRALDPRSDIFSFGIVLYEMLSGRNPFKKESTATTTSAILTEEPRPIAGMIEGLPEGLNRVVARMLAKEPGDRYPSMGAVLADLRVILAEARGAKAKPWFKPARMAATAAVVAAAVLGAAWLAKTLFFKTPAQALAFQERDWILVTDFDNKTGEEVFDAGLETALTVSIQQSQYVNVFPPGRVQETLRRMRREGVARIDEAVGREVALREGIKALLVGGIGRVGDEYLLSAKLVDPDNQAIVFSGSARARTGTDILAGVDELAKKVRNGLGESLARISKERLPLYQATTSSLESLKLYSGSKRVPWDVSIEQLKKAIELDPDFALAHVELGVKYYINGRRADGEVHFQKALGLIDRQTTREQLWIRALVEDWRGNREEGIRNYRAYLAQYPDDNAAWFRLGYAYMLSNQAETAIECFDRVIRIDKGSADAHINLASSYSMLDRRDEALDHYRQAFALDPGYETGTFVNNEYGFLLVRMGKVEEAEAAFRKMIAEPENWKRAKGYRSLGLLQMYRGRYGEALESLGQAVGVNRSLKAGLSEFRDRLFLAIALRRKGQEAACEKELAAMEAIRAAIKIEPTFLAKLGTFYARSGRVREAERILDAVRAVTGDVLAASGVGRSSQGDQAAFHRLKGEIELARGRYEEAVASFTMAGNLRELMLEDALALAYARSGDIDRAIEKYEEFLGKDVLGYEAQDLWTVAHYELARLYEARAGKGAGGEARADAARADAEAAAKHHRRFLELWKDADSDLLRALAVGTD
ncbi:MAG: tetratricopeptide repeat protein [Candidatus Aminicenantes bacterium]|nr:tetratricopeptide repeat protein [Candidatus Aminicenantes bacterium]